MRSRPSASAGAVVLTCLGLGASLASLVDYLGPTPTFCAESGCATVRASAWAYPLGIPMPLFGVVFFGAMLALAFAARPKLRFALAMVGAAWALALLGVQAMILGAWCKLCMVSDISAIALGIAIVAGAQTIRFTAARALCAGVGIAALPLVFAIATAPSQGDDAVPVASAAPSKVPAEIVRERVPGAVTIVEFVDFECPFCRKLAPELAAAVRDTREPVKVIRRMVPIKAHPHAKTAALAWCCADAQGKGDEMADALFSAPADELTPDGCEQLAAQVGCDLDRYRQTLADPATADRIAADMAEAQAAGANNLPTVFVGDLRLTGANHTTADLLAAIDQAAR